MARLTPTSNFSGSPARFCPYKNVHPIPSSVLKVAKITCIRRSACRFLCFLGAGVVSDSTQAPIRSTVGACASVNSCADS